MKYDPENLEVGRCFPTPLWIYTCISINFKHALSFKIVNYHPKNISRDVKYTFAQQENV